jgi:hypothetical protein
MTKTIIIFYLVMFGIYVLFSRQPDWFDSELYPATIQSSKNASTGVAELKAVFVYNGKSYMVDADYPLRAIQVGDRVAVIFELNNPKKAAYYACWGYWIKWGELIGSIVLCLILFQVAIVVNKNPDEAARQRDLARMPEIKRKYD